MRQNPAAPLDSLPALPYATDALEPYVDKETMEIHYNRYLILRNSSIVVVPQGFFTEMHATAQWGQW